MSRRSTAAAPLSLLAFLFAAGLSHAGTLVFETSASLPPLMGVYSTGSPGACFSVPGPGTVCMEGDGSVRPNSVRSAISAGNQFTFFDLPFNASITDGTSHVLGSISLDGRVQVEVFNRTSDTDLGTFSTQMLNLDLSGTIQSPGPLGGQPLMLRLQSEDPNGGPPTTGQTTVTTSNPGFMVSSFFDVFTEISLDGGGTWIPQSNAPTTVGLQATPEPASFVLVAAGCLAAALWRRRAARAVRKLA